jgi:hypothetical protein
VQAAEFLLEEIAPHFPTVEFIIAGSYVPETLQKDRNVVFSDISVIPGELFHARIQSSQLHCFREPDNV